MPQMHDWLCPENWGTPRWKTAIKRPELSLPLRNATASNELPKTGSWLDFGSGHGLDVVRLPEQYRAAGFDPYYNPRFELISSSYSVVSLIYVLNVIESDSDRDRTLEFAFSLCTAALIVAIRTDKKVSGITSIGTFQKYYNRKQFLSYLQSQCPGKTVVDIGSGQAIVLKK